MKCIQFSLLILVFLCSMGSSYGQNGNIEGIVQNEAGQAVAGAQVSLSSGSHTVYSGDDGYFQLQNVPAGSYTLTIRKTGYQDKVIPVTLGSGQTLDLGFIIIEDETGG